MNRVGPWGPIIVWLAGLLFGACSHVPAPSPSNNSPAQVTTTPAAASPSPLTDFERDLKFIRDGGYTYIYIFSRKDGKPFEPTDSDFLRKNAPQIVDWAKTDGGKRFIGGTNFNLEEGNLAALKKRYNVEDYSGK